MSSGGKDVKTNRIIVFTLTFSNSAPIALAFRPAESLPKQPKAIFKHYKRILYALDHMDENCRQRWDQYLRENPNEEEAIMHNWDRFEE